MKNREPRDCLGSGLRIYRTRNVKNAPSTEQRPSFRCSSAVLSRSLEEEQLAENTGVDFKSKNPKLVTITSIFNMLNDYSDWSTGQP